MNGQMTIFDLLYPKRINPIREVAKRSRPYWKESKQKLIDLCDTDPDISIWSKAVKDEYCPYGCAGHYGGDDKPNTLIGWDMGSSKIKTIFNDNENQRQERWYSWADFSREIADMIWSGEYEEEN